MVVFERAFNNLNTFKALVIGDFMLDKYTIGTVQRISPEAPVSVLKVEREEYRPGGAGNVALNLTSLGGDVVSMGRVGKDEAGELLKNVLQEANVSPLGLISQDNHQTPIKNRMIAESQQIVRVDHENIQEITPELEEEALGQLEKLIETVQVVGISDYGKGFLKHSLLEKIIAKARRSGVAVIVDPKGIDFSKYRHATIIKPNKKEAYEAAGLPKEAPIEDVAAKLLEITAADHIMITRSEEGISLFSQNGDHKLYPVNVRQVCDVTGAGDTVLSTLMCSMANNLPIEDAVKLSNIAAGIAVEHFGCARICLAEIAQRLLEENVVNKVFEEEHLFALRQILKGKQAVILGVYADKGLTPAIFKAIKQYGKNHQRELLLYIRDPHPDEELLRVLASFHDISYIIIKSESLDNLCRVVKPSAVYVVEGQSIAPLQRVENLLG
ncbi:MAG: D-glycero-beta-D-manno-heptose-7-phosphate kinase [Chlamydiota bacterium]